MIIAVIGVIILFTLAPKLYSMISPESESEMQAKSILQNIHESISGLSLGETSKDLIMLQPKGWWLVSFDKEDSNKPGECKDDSCICVCSRPDCTRNAICDDFKKQLYKDGNPVALQINLQFIYIKNRDNFYELVETAEETGDAAKIAKLMEYAKENTVSNRKCYCEDKCDDYAESIVEHSTEYGIDPALLIALIMQESSCKGDAVGSGGEAGLVQISSPVFNDVCKGKLEGINEFGDIKGKGNAGKNIECGAKILKSQYNTFGAPGKERYYKSLVKKYCTNPDYQKKYLSYSGWEAALRAYNGLACKSTSVTDYVDQIMGRYEKLKEVLKSL